MADRPQLDDARTAPEGLALLAQAVMDVPDEAVGIDTTFGKRAESAGGGWYWGVKWTLAYGSVDARNPHRVDKGKALVEAMAEALDAIRREAEAAQA